MAGFTKKMLEEIENKSNEYLKIDEFDKDYVLNIMKEDEGIDAQDITYNTIINVYAMAIALCKQNEKDNIDARVFFNCLTRYKIDGIQLHKMMNYYKDVTEIEDLDDLGDIKYCDEEAQDEKVFDEEQSRIFDNNIYNEDKPEKPTNIYDEAIKIFNKADELSFKDTVKHAYNQNKTGKLFNTILFDDDFFNDIINDERIEENINEKNGDNEKTVDAKLRDLFNEVNHNTDEDLEVGISHEERTDRAKENIGIYLTLRQRGEKRGFLDVIFHPIDTYREYKLRNEVKNFIKDQYGFTNKTLDSINKMVCVDKEVKKDFVAFDNNGKEFVEGCSQEEKESFINNWDLKYSDYNKNSIDAIKNMFNYLKDNKQVDDQIINIAKDTSLNTNTEMSKNISNDNESELNRSMDSNI